MAYIITEAMNAKAVELSELASNNFYFSIDKDTIISMFKHLEMLRMNGKANMHEAAPNLANEFGIEKIFAYKVLNCWIKLSVIEVSD